MSLLRLSLLFMKIGLTTFGGGYAMLPILRHELVMNRHWLSEEELAEIYALAQCLPGLIFVNVSVLLVKPRKGAAAAWIAGFSVAFPSLVIILLIAKLLTDYAHIQLVQHAFAGIRIAVAATVVSSVWSLLKSGVKDIFSGAIAALSFLLLLLTPVNPVFVILAAGLMGLFIQSGRAKKEAGR